MQRVYRRKQKIWAGFLREVILIASFAVLFCFLFRLPAQMLRTVSAWSLRRSRPAIVKYAIHMETPRMSLLEKLLSPRLVSFSFEEAVREGTITETLGEAMYGFDASESASSDSAFIQAVDGTSEDEAGTDGYTADTGISLLLSVEPDEQAGLLQENIYGSTGAESTGSAQESDVGQSSDSAQIPVDAASDLTVFDEITQEDETGNFSYVRQQIFNLADFDSFEALIKEFYVVDSSTQATASLINLESLTSCDCTISKEDEAPQILIYHSHSQEGYADSDANDPSTTIVGVGEYLTQLLEGYGYSVLHHEGTYDLPSRDDAYSKALPAIEALLEEYPSIEVVIDLHRDAVAEGTKLVYTYEGKDYARFMFFNGLSRTASGPINYLYNENLSANLAFSFQAEVIAESYFPGITRGIYLKAWRYNMHLMPKYMLIELGAQTNTVEEAMNTCEILAFVLDQVLSGESE
ncbi:MAG: stage II sporulation protein P [Lachnospiraceae bacterium]|nr:stage II sporulation protein P [Lachnospiraceae bacterium]